ncbi:hypothetical protein PIB30_095124 [Stylosanthes scabra]|uniref:Uncharacterized protein n=1 Tax=Stylosanthes scabra TaxID=79078 RepID=A0ABU6RWD5_9FABA|nr:hypothetical protein [Stylosanthes scabra]
MPSHHPTPPTPNPIQQRQHKRTQKERLIERDEILDIAGLHFLDLDLGPQVHGDESDEGDVDAETAVFAGAFEAHEDVVGDRGPLHLYRKLSTKIYISYHL